MASGYYIRRVNQAGTVETVDLDQLFKPRVNTDPEGPSTGFKTADGKDLSKRFFASTGTEDRVSTPTGFAYLSGGVRVDLSASFRDAAYTGGAPAITVHPVSATGIAGQNVTLSVVATGAEPLTYAWERNVGAGYVSYGPNAAQLTISSVTSADAGSYRVVVSNAIGSVTSSVATLGVFFAPVAGNPSPNSGTYDVGNVLSFSVSPTPGNPAGLTYTWKKDGATLINGMTSKWGGLGTDTLTFVSEKNDHQAAFTCVVSNSVGSSTSGAAQFDLRYQPEISVQPFTIAVNEGSFASFVVGASAYPSPTYQWQKDTGSGFTDIPAATSAALNFTSAALADVGAYRCAVTNIVGTTYSAVAQLTVYAAPGVVSGPSGFTAAAGTGPYALTCIATGGGTLYFQWFKDGNAITPVRPGNLSYVSDQHVFAAGEEGLTAADAGSYTVKITNSVGSGTDTSAPAVVVVT